MSDPDLATRHIGVLRNAARGGQERFLVALPDPAERQRIASTLANEGFVVEVESNTDALARLADESFDLAFLTLDDERDGRPAGGVARAAPLHRSRADHRERSRPLRRRLRPRGRRGAAARPARGRRPLARARQAAGRIPALAHARPAGDERLRRRSRGAAGRGARPDGGDRPPGGRGQGRADDPGARAIRSSARAAGPLPAAAAPPDAVVVGLGADETLDARLAEARARAPGAAVIIVDGRPDDRTAAQRDLRRRARLPAAHRGAMAILGRVAASAALRRRHEALGDPHGRDPGPLRDPQRRRSHARRRRRCTKTSTCA